MHPLPPQVADAKHPSVHSELRELVTFRGPVDAVYKAAPEKVSLDTGSGAWAGLAGWLAGSWAPGLGCWAGRELAGGAPALRGCLRTPAVRWVRGPHLAALRSLACPCWGGARPLLPLRPLRCAAGDVVIANSKWPEAVLWTPWTSMEACYK